MFLVVREEMFGTGLDTDTLHTSDGLIRSFAVKVWIGSKARIHVSDVMPRKFGILSTSPSRDHPLGFASKQPRFSQDTLEWVE